MKHILYSILIAIPLLAANSADLLINVDHRQTTSLNGAWQYIIDPYETGFFDYQLGESRDGFFRNQQVKEKSDRIEYRFTEEMTLNVPGDWNTQDDKLFYYEGTLWYKKDFQYQKKADTRTFLYFGAVNYQADVYVNGRKAGHHIGGFTPFNLEVTGLLTDGDNFVVVKVDNKRLREGVPTINTDWWNYGGITRDVKLVEVPQTCIRDYMLQLEPGSTRKVTGWVQLDGSKLQQRITVEIPELRVKESVFTDDNGRAEITIRRKFRLWSPGDPKLYTVRIKSESEMLEDQIGFRSIETKGTDLLLNGEPVYLKGICIHEEAPIRGGRAFSKSDAVTLLSWAKELGCNFVRLAHYPHNEWMTRTADEMGIMVWSEVPVYWTVLFDNEETLANARNQLTEEITRDKNKASVIIWSIANETPVNPVRTAFLKTLADKARALDNTRLISAATDKQSSDGRVFMIDDPIGDVLDVIGINEYIGWYDGLPEKCDRVVWQSKYDKPVIVSEFGGGALFGYHADAETRWTEEYQEHLYEKQVNMLKKVDFIKGTCPWILMDFRSPRRPLYGIQDGWNRKGLISNRGEKKKAFYIMQDYYKSR